MILKQFLVYLLCLTLAFPLDVFAAAPAAPNPLRELLIQQRDIKTGYGSMKMLSKHGKALADATFKMMNDPKNRKWLASPEGIELRKHQQALVNFLAVKDHFEKCVKNKNSKRKLNERILDAAFQGMTNIKDMAVPCKPPASFAKDYLTFNNNVMATMKTMVRPYFQNELTKQIMTNTAKSLLAFKQKFQPNYMGQGVLKQGEMMEVINDVCNKKSGNPRAPTTTDVCSNMGPGFKRKMAQELIDFSRTLPKNGKMSPERATASLNSAIDRLNSTLAKIKVGKDVGYIYDTANLKNPESRKGFDRYVNQYMIEVSKDAGSLLLSKTMKDEAGGIKSFTSSDTEKNRTTRNFQFVPHKKVQVDDVRRSIKEIEGKMMAQARDTLAIAGDSTRVKGKLIADNQDINELVKINPFAAGQVLLRQPQYAGLMCDAINTINQKDVDDENFDKYFMIGTAVLGGALLLTGVGTVAGAYLITGSLTAGVAAGTIGGSILGYTALAGSAMEMASAGYYGKKSYESYQEMNRLEAAYLTQNSDQTAIIEAKNALVEFKDARMTAGISLASVGLSIASAGKLFNILKFTNAKITPDEVKAATKIMRYLGNTQVAKRLKDTARLWGEIGAEKIDNFLVRLARVGEKNRVRFLELLKDAKMTPEKLREIVDAALDAAKNCAKL